jgi:hypothetical protein
VDKVTHCEDRAKGISLYLPTTDLLPAPALTPTYFLGPHPDGVRAPKTRAEVTLAHGACRGAQG